MYKLPSRYMHTPVYVQRFVPVSYTHLQDKLPIWPLMSGETDQMPGYSSVPVIADAYLKG